MENYFDNLNRLLQSNIPFVSVIVVDTTGSVPQDAGSKMLVTHEGLVCGTVGGGKVEKRAIEEAQNLLRTANPAKSTYFVNWSLNKDIGMTCGGMVKLFFETYNTNTWKVVVFGAGHVSQAVINLLTNLECRITCIDPRLEWLSKLSDNPKLKTECLDDMPSYVKNIADNSFVLLVTMGHTTDKPILIEILKNRQFPYIGVIGSDAKAARLKKDIAEAGLPDTCQNQFFCPMGLNLGSNHPQEIAISIVAQLLEQRDKWKSKVVL
jgi:xanthine dehydrogenase accessory factor